MRERLSRAVALVLACSLPVVSAGARQEPQARAAQDGYEDEVVRITTNLVQVDAVVVDKNGRQVTDLRAEDFEIFEDGKPQQISNFSYVSIQTPAAAPLVARTTTRGGTLNVAPPPVLLRREQVRRTIALVVDDLGLSFESIGFVRKALQRYVDEQMQAGDMAAIIRTSAGVGALQQFTSDKHLLTAAIERVRWYPMGTGGPSAFRAIETDERARFANYDDLVNGRLSAVAGRSDELRDQQAGEQNEFRQELFSVGTLGALNFVVNGLRELPGRKSVVLFSDGLRLFNTVKQSDRRDPRTEERGTAGGDQPGGGRENARIKGQQAPGFRQNNRVVESLRRLTDLANRASVVIYTMDARGLLVGGLQATDNTADLSADVLEQRLGERRGEIYETQEGLIYLSRLTGGFTIRNSNDLGRGLGRILDDQRGYYLIGYRPDAQTFDAVEGRKQFHKINVRVRRAGVRVRTRTGFYGVAEEEARRAAATPEAQLSAALSSPFTSGNIGLRLTALFQNEPQRGSLLRSVLHINARDLTFKAEADGTRRAVIDVLAFAYGDDGRIARQFSHREEMSAGPRVFPDVLEHGIIYSLDVPLQKAGAYQLRVAVRDAASGRVGSANQFVEAPDLQAQQLALSGIVVSGRRMRRADARGPSQNASTLAVEGAFAGAVEEAEPDAEAIPAVRRFRRGMMLSYVYVVHNAQRDAANARPRVVTQARLFRDGELVFSGRPVPLDPVGQPDPARLNAGGRIYLGANLSHGNYVLQVVVRDSLAPVKRSLTTQWIDFEIAPDAPR
ncbi:MAG TPA: VWA domain-containing protein [Pyrinomonadaceae bacterium]|nr:VWA domain-containing protein [Pyrinomonadaceae bacterium]